MQITKFNILTRMDIERAVKSISELGSCSILNKEYVCTVPLALTNDFSELMTLAE